MNHRVSKQILSILLCFVILLGMLPITALAAETTVITSANATITKPVGGEKPDSNPAPTGEGYTVRFVKWYLGEEPFTDVDVNEGTFEAGKSYALRVTFELKEGYSFADDCVFTINGEETACFGASIAMRQKIYTAADGGVAPPTTYTVTVNGGIASPAGPNTEGTEVTITATPPANMGFKQWNGLDGVTFVDDTNKQSATATFKMPAEAVEATAVYGINNVTATATGNITPVLGNNAETNPTFTYNFSELGTMPNSTWRYSSDGEEWEYAGYTEATKKFCAGYWYFDLNAKLNGLSISDPCTVTVNGTKWQIKRPSVNLAADSPVYYLDAEGNVSVVMFKIDGVTATCPAMPKSLSAEDTLPHLTFTPSPQQAVIRGDGTWQKKSGDNWVNANGAVEAGKTYRYETKMHIDASVATHTFANDVTLKVNGTSWTVDYGTMQENGTSSVSVMVYSPEITVTEATTYTVTFDANGGTGTMSDVTGVFGEYTLPANGFTAPEGKQFKAWSVNGKEKAVGDKITVTADTTITAIWEAVEYDVTVTGGTASVGAGTPITKATMGTTVTLIANNAPSGKVFDKWIVNGVVVADANSATTTFTMPAGNVTAQATYKDIPIVTYTVSFNANGGSGEMADVTGMSGDYLLPMCTFTAPAGKQFKCWAEDSVNGTQYYAGYGCVVDSDVTFYAIWEDIPVTYYTVTFDSNGGSAVTAQSIEAGQKATKPADPTKDGYDFKGWTLNGSAYDFNTAVNGNITLVAAWEQQQVVPTTYTVSFAANGGSGSMADVTGISGEYTLPANGFTAPEGKQFKAWSVNGSEKAVGDKITVTADTTVTAVWENIPAGHTCDIKPVAKVEPSCTEGGKEAYYKCEGCGKFYEDALGTKEITDLAAWGNLAKLGHSESDWKSDKDNHWKECTVAGCGVIIENSKAAHADTNNDGKCDVCEYNVGKTSTNPGNKPSDDVQNPQTGDNSMMGLWIALLFVSGFGVVTTTVYGKKRKSVK